MSDEELVKRLRVSNPCCEEHHTQNEAADRIEAMTKERDEANKRGDAWRFRADIAEVKLAKAVEGLRVIEADCEADYPPSQLATKYAARAIIAEIEGDKK